MSDQFIRTGLRRRKGLWKREERMEPLPGSISSSQLSPFCKMEGRVR